MHGLLFAYVILPVPGLARRWANIYNMLYHMYKHRNILAILLMGGCFVTYPVIAASPDKPSAVADNTEAAQVEDMPETDNFGEGFTASYLASQHASRNGDIDAAIHFLRDVYRRDPSNSELARKLQGFLLLNGDTEEALKMSDAVRKSNVQDPIAALLVTLQSVKRGDMQSAKNILTESFKDASGQLWLPLVSAWLDLSLQKMEKPITLESMSVDVGRAAPVVNYHLALINDKAGFEDAAAKNFRDAVEDVENPPSRVFAALQAFYKNNNSPEVLKSIIDANKDKEAYSEAATAKISNTSDGIAEVLYTMGSIMLGANVNQDAIIYLHLATYLRSDFPAASQALGEAYSSIQQFAKSNEAFGKIRESSHLHASAQINIALNLQRMGKHSEAIALLDRIGKKKETAYDAMVIKGDVLRSNMNLAESVAAYSQAIKQITEPDSKHWAVYFARGATYERMGKWDEAEKDLQQALVLQPDQPDVLNYLGYSWLTQGRNLEEAKSMIAKALSMKPHDPQIIDSMGWAFYIVGDYSRAAKYLEKAVDLIPSDTTVNEHLGDVYWLQGRKAEARFQWERSITFSDDESVKEAIRKKIRDGVYAAPGSGVRPPVVASQRLREDDPAN